MAARPKSEQKGEVWSAIQLQASASNCLRSVVEEQRSVQRQLLVTVSNTCLSQWSPLVPVPVLNFMQPGVRRLERVCHTPEPS